MPRNAITTCGEARGKVAGQCTAVSGPLPQLFTSPPTHALTTYPTLPPPPPTVSSFHPTTAFVSNVRSQKSSKCSKSLQQQAAVSQVQAWAPRLGCDCGSCGRGGLWNFLPATAGQLPGKVPAPRATQPALQALSTGRADWQQQRPPAGQKQPHPSPHHSASAALTSAASALSAAEGSRSAPGAAAPAAAAAPSPCAVAALAATAAALAAAGLLFLCS